MPLTQSAYNVFVRQSPAATVEPPLGGGWQDNPAPHTARSASPQPAPHTKITRAVPLETKPPRTQKRSNHKRSTKVTFWITPLAKAELERLANQEGLSLSATGAAFLEEAIRQHLHVQHAVLLQPIIETAIHTSMRSFSNRLAFLLVRSCFTSEQTRSLVTNILGRLPTVTPEIYNSILDGSSKTAKRNMTRKTPQLETVLAELEALFREEADGN